jgi:hypothetical protein
VFLENVESLPILRSELRKGMITESLESSEGFPPSKMGISQACFDLARRQPVEDLGSIHLEAHTAFDQGGPKLPEVSVRYGLAPQMSLIFFRTLKVL